MNTSVIPALIHTANHPYPSLKRRGCSNVIPATCPPKPPVPRSLLSPEALAKGDGEGGWRRGKAGIHSHKSLRVVLAGAGFALFLTAAPALAATAPATQNSGVSPAGRDVLKFLGDTAYRSGLTNSPDPNADTTDVYDIIAAIINTVLGLTGIIFFIQVFWAGFRWMTAGGAEETITTAKKTITSSVIGIAIALSAFVITNFVLNKIEEINKGGGEAPTAPAETLGWCQVVTKPDAQPVALWGDCRKTTGVECEREAKTSDPVENRFSWGPEQTSTCNHPVSQ